MSERILVVEDDLLNRIFLADTLEGHGYSVKTVADGALVVSAAKSFCPDLITMDINLPHVSGLELIEQLHVDPQFRGLPILAITAYVGMSEESNILKAGAAGYLSKPISIQPFITKVRSLLSD